MNNPNKGKQLKPLEEQKTEKVNFRTTQENYKLLKKANRGICRPNRPWIRDCSR
jgi:hypothetical protein